MRILQGELEIARYLGRPHRFAVECELEGSVVSAHLPNPGRLWELLTPRCILYLKRNGGDGKTTHTVMAVEKHSTPVMLHTHLTNTVVEALLRRGAVPGLADAVIVRREASFGESRFDFLLEREGKMFVLEVKNCTLFGDTLAMFPDAVTARGSRHLTGLLDLKKKGVDAGVLFVVQWPHARFFMPEYHTDLEFSRIFLSCRDRLFTRAIGLTWYKDLSFDENVKDLVIPWELLERKVHDGGCYIVILRLDDDREIAIGELGNIFFRKGYYLYVGSAKRSLTKRIDRHQRSRKTLFWHIDYLREKTVFHKGLPIRTQEDWECELASDLKGIADWSVPGFGCSDCSCSSHLFGMAEDPVKSTPFIDLLIRYRIGMVEEELGRDGY